MVPETPGKCWMETALSEGFECLVRLDAPVQLSYSLWICFDLRDGE
jgi:hypothetical protein